MNLQELADSLLWFCAPSLDDLLRLTHAKIIHQSSAVLFFKITKRLMSRPTTKIVARTNVMVVTTKTALLDDSFLRFDDISTSYNVRIRAPFYIICWRSGHGCRYIQSTINSSTLGELFDVVAVAFVALVAKFPQFRATVGSPLPVSLTLFQTNSTLLYEW
jgi:hypothetical protein